MAPASVGVASPRKIVPRTRKISPNDGMIPRRHFLHSAQPLEVRASGGSAGTSFGQSTLTISTQMQNKAIWMRLGPMAPAYMSPTERPSWSASTTSTSDGGELGNGPGGRDDAHRVARRIAVADHARHRNHTHGDDRRRHRAGDRSQYGADEESPRRTDRRAPDRTIADQIEQVLGEPAALEMAPMKVKNGIASNRSFETMPNSCR